MADNIAYPGNPGLPKEVREKILSTFRHSLNLYKAGKQEDCAVGCEFILKMDPRFVPAKRLLEKARDPAASTDVAELESYVAETLTPMEKLGSTAPDKLLISAIEAYADRDFDSAIENSNRVLSVLPGNKDAREILEKATRKKELQPHVDNFRQRALFALESGQKDEARRNFERMRSLDPEHPEVERLAERLRDEPVPADAAPAEAANPFDFPFGDLGPPPADSDSGGIPAFTTDAVFAAPAPPPAVPPTAPAEALDSLSLDIPETADWSPIPAPADEGGLAPPPSPEQSFAGMWDTTAPEISVDAPSAPAAPRAEHSALSVSPEIQSLLDEGDRLSEKGDHPGAIETWSRIFLSDLSNPEAATRIENARTRLAETNRRVSEALKQGRALYESGQPKDAREKFLEVLAIDENEATARAFLHRIEDDLARPTVSYDLAAVRPAGDVLAEDDEPGGSAAPADMPVRRAQAPRSPSRRTPLLLAAGLLVAIAAALFLIWRPRGSAPAPPPPPAAGAAGNPIGEATRLFQAGNVEAARETLLAIPSSSPQYGRARKMLANFGPASPTPAGESPATASVTGTATAVPPSAAAQRHEAETALSEHRYIAALSGFHQTAPAYPGDADLKKELAEAAAKVQEISPAVRLFNDGDYDSSLPILWRLYQADHQNVDVKSYLVRCYYNQGVIALQNNLFDKAAKTFGDALGVEPDDALSRRQKTFAERYAKRPPDLLARVYLKYLRPRP
jgi:tetratricopeptide (TPR) repeat protein